eukprot:5088442-Amphidinium_carterae.1
MDVLGLPVPTAQIDDLDGIEDDGMEAGIPPTRSRSRTRSEHAPSTTSTIDYGQGRHSVASTREYRSDESHDSAQQP